MTSFTQFFQYRFWLALSCLLISLSQAEELGSGDFELTTQGHSQKAMHVDSTYDIAIEGMIATVTLEQQFQNDSTAWLNGRYVFPLAETASVSFMQIRLGERVITSQIKEKAAARKTFEAAKKAGKKAALTEQHRPNVFSQSVANIGPGETIIVTLKYNQPVDYNDGVFSFRLPTTMMPRYQPPTSGLVASNPEQSPVLQTTKANFGAWFTTQNTQANYGFITAKLTAGLPLASVDTLYHETLVQKQQDTHLIETKQSRVLLDRDYVLQWRASSRQQPQAAVFYETIANERYAMVMVVPPTAAHTEALARESLFIIDSSGSMQGPSMPQAKESLLLALAKLSAKDYFNIYDFDSHYRQLFDQSQLATPSNLAAAKQFVNGLRADGGTEMAAPLAAALTAPTPQNETVRQVIFITDGAVGNEAQLFNLIDQNLGHARLFTVGIGHAPNSYFMRKAAQFGRGSFTHIGDVSQVSTKMSQLFEKLSRPQMQQLQLRWHGTTPETWPTHIPDLYAGEPLLLYSKLHDNNDKLVISGKLNNKTWQQVLSIATPASPVVAHGGISKLWARQKIDALLDQKFTGSDESTVKTKVLKVALKHHLLSPYTSLVAVEERISRPIEHVSHDKQLPLNLPKGSPAALAIPQTAAGLWHYLLNVLICLVLLVLMRLKTSAPA